MKNFIFSILIVLSVGFLFSIIYYNYSLKSVGNKEEVITINIEYGSSIDDVIVMLREENLIKSELCSKIYTSINNIDTIVFGRYEFSFDMDVEEIFKRLEKGSNLTPNIIKVTIIEGYNISKVANIFEEKTNNVDLLNFWNSDEFVDRVIKKYDFITNEIKNSDIKYALEGYFYPATYEFINENITEEDIAFKLLDEMEYRLSKYEDDTNNSKYSIHEILTLASIIEYEAILESDRYMISGVFHNRLNIGMKLQSCATLDYALDTHKLVYTLEDMAVESAYNTYYVEALSVGPSNMPRESSIAAALNPQKHDYYYFLSNVYDNSDVYTYYATTYEEHLINKEKYLK